MAGIVASPSKENDVVYEKNLRLAAKSFEKENILGLIEPINNYSVQNYYLNDYDKGKTTCLLLYLILACL